MMDLIMAKRRSSRLTIKMVQHEYNRESCRTFVFTIQEFTIAQINRGLLSAFYVPL